MSIIQSKVHFKSFLLFLLVFALVILAFGCGTKVKKETKAENEKTELVDAKSPKSDKVAKSKSKYSPTKVGLIEIKKNSPADTVRVFYKRLRERKFRNAFLLTNLRPAIEGLTDEELKELGVDFGTLSQQVPVNMPINGEIVTGKTATVTVKMPNDETGKIEVQQINLRKEGDNWVVLVADAEGEKMMKKEGKNYFFALRMDVHHKEAKAMLDRIGKAQMVYSMKNKNKFADLHTLIKKGYVPADAKNSATTGYKYDVLLGTDGVTYTALATPAVYGKTGKLSFALKITRNKQPQLISKDLKGKPVNG